MTSLSRREFIKTSIAATTAATAGFTVSQAALAQASAAEAGWKWDKGVCRFCGVGCGEQVATFNGRIVAIKGDPDAPVNRGLNCIKGYFNGRILYGEDRLTRPLMRMKGGKFDKTGDFVPVTWDQALDEIAAQFKRIYKAKGPSAVAMLTSGQSLVSEGYITNKLIKAGFRSNNIDPNARLCMASAVVAFYQCFGVDEPANCYDDFELADTTVLWSNNMAEAHPILWSRVTDHRLKDKNSRIINVTTYRNMCSDIADLEIIYKPNTDLAILNYIAREMVKRNAVNMDFVNKHCVFTTGPVDIGFGMRPTDKFAFPAEKDTLAKQLNYTIDKYEAIGQRRPDMAGRSIEQKDAGRADAHWHITFDEYKRGVEPYNLDFVAELAKGDPSETLDAFKKKLQQLADYYIADKSKKIISLWCMGVNQHVRGVWVNQQIYALHLLLGKHGTPGNGAFSLTGQPTACGTAREVGTFCHRLPSDMLVANPAHREKTEKLWKLPAKTLNPRVGTALMIALRGLEDGSVNFVWTQTVNLWQSVPNTNHWLKAARNPDNFVVVADAYPTLSGKVADVILPAAMIFEKWGMFGNAERRMQCWRQLVNAPGQARPDAWMMLEFSKRFTLKEVWGELPLPGLKVEGFPDDKLPSVLEEAKKMGYNENMTLYEALFATPDNKKFKWPDPVAKGTENSIVNLLGDGWFVEKALFEEYRPFTFGGHDLAPFDMYYDDKIRGLRWPIIDGKETLWRFSEGNDPYVKPGEGHNFHGKLLKAIPSGDLDGVKDTTPKPLPGKAKIFFRPYASYPEKLDSNYNLQLCTGRILEHWHTGSMTRRVPELHRAAPTTMLDMNPADAEARGLKHQDIAWVETRRGKIKMVVNTRGRNKMPPGTIWAAFFDEGVQVNQLTLDAADPLSLEPDYKKAAAKVYKA
ncbi:MAG: nitrate reductase catalytic subunit NapA [Burkholderiales bacterium]|jgi:nitrate reductase NapA|nr:nitrate reductase catalytic subunit NapA [Burkholderiales bacterium]